MPQLHPVVHIFLSLSCQSLCSEPKVVSSVEASLNALASNTRVSRVVSPALSTNPQDGLPKRVVLPDMTVSEQCGRGNNWALGYHGGRAAKRRDLTQSEIEDRPGRRETEYKERSTNEARGPKYPQSRLSRVESGRVKHTREFTTDWSEGGQRGIGNLDEGEEGSLSVRALEAIRKQAEKCDRFTAALVLNSVSGGTGSGLGSRVSEGMRDLFGWKQLMVNAAVTPLMAGEVALQHYNTVLSMSKVREVSDAVWLCSNEDLLTTLEHMHTVTTSEATSESSNYSSITVPSSSASSSTVNAFTRPGQLSFGGVNAYFASSLLDFMAPWYRASLFPPRRSSVHNSIATESPLNATEIQWSDIPYQFACSTASVAPLPGANFFELWNSAGLMSLGSTSSRSRRLFGTNTSSSGMGGGGRDIDTSWRRHVDALSQLVPRTLPTIAEGRRAWTEEDEAVELWNSTIRQFRRVQSGRLSLREAFASSRAGSTSSSTAGIPDTLLRAISGSTHRETSIDPISSWQQDQSHFTRTLALQATFSAAKSPASYNPFVSLIGDDRMPGVIPSYSWETETDTDMAAAKTSITRLFPLAPFASSTQPSALSPMQDGKNTNHSTPFAGHSFMPTACPSLAAYRRHLGLSISPTTTTSSLSKLSSNGVNDGKCVQVAVNRGRIAYQLLHNVNAAELMLRYRAYTHWYERYGCSVGDIYEAIESVREVVDNYRAMLT